ncbi:hypothetical protein F5Y05DRAFT_375563 [Hypoxylon sp. FL0543]|nr:hypothetical protein F5Y05DRAFT_375563 [Hypoxylon sp. FL0543]
MVFSILRSCLAVLWRVKLSHLIPDAYVADEATKSCTMSKYSHPVGFPLVVDKCLVPPQTPRRANAACSSLSCHQTCMWRSKDFSPT